MFRSLVSRLLLVALSLVVVGCQGAGDEARPTAQSVPVVVPAQFTADEEQLIGTIESFYGALVEALATADVQTDDAQALASQLEAHMDPMLEPIRAARDDYEALANDRRTALHQEVFRRHPEQMQALMVETSRFAARFQHPERAKQFRPIANAVFEPWVEARAFWVFEGFGPAAVRELTEWTTETEEEEQARKQRAAS